MYIHIYIYIYIYIIYIKIHINILYIYKLCKYIYIYVYHIYKVYINLLFVSYIHACTQYLNKSYFRYIYYFQRISNGQNTKNYIIELIYIIWNYFTKGVLNIIPRNQVGLSELNNEKYHGTIFYLI